MWKLIILYLITGFVIALVTRAKPSIRKEIGDTDLKSTPAWKSILFVTIIYGGAILLWPVFIKSWFEKPKSVWDTLNKNPIFQKEKELNDAMQNLCADGIDADEFPNGHGEFGLTLTNPVPCNTVHGSIAYLSRLVTDDGSKINYERIASYGSEVTAHPVDGYKITNENGESLATIYISPYQRRNSNKAPQGFKLVI